MEISTDKKIIEKILNKGVEQILPSKDGLRELLESKRRLSIYQGFDPTGPTLHIGHTVGMRKLEEFRQLGHEVIFLIGDFTARIGDPSDKAAARKKLTKEQVEENLKVYVQQASHFIDMYNKDNPVKILYNSEWLEPLNFADIIELSSEFTVQQMLKRSMFQKRIEEDKPIYINEFMYPLMQGYDSVMMNIDIEVGGNDQLFNMMAGRDLVRSRLNKEKFVLAGKLLETQDGKKMGKTEGNMIRLDDNANDIFGKVMSFPDEHIVLGFEILTDSDLEKIEQVRKDLTDGKNPMDLKKELAYILTKDIKGEDEANSAKEYFETVFQSRSTDTQLDEIEINNTDINILDLLVNINLAKSKSDGRRLIEQNAVTIDEQKISDWKMHIQMQPSSSSVIKCGKRLLKITYIP